MIRFHWFRTGSLNIPLFQSLTILGTSGTSGTSMVVTMRGKKMKIVSLADYLHFGYARGKNPIGRSIPRFTLVPTGSNRGEASSDIKT